MKAVIMAGGEGSRLRPLTCDRPKPLVPVCNRPVMSYILELLESHGFTDVYVTLGYMPGAITSFFGDRYDRMAIRYNVEETPLGTAGGVACLRDWLDDTFVVISGDALTDVDLSKLLAFHRERKALATLAMTRVSTPLEYGVIMTDSTGLITRFLEKPGWGEVFSDTVNTGIYVLEPDVLRGIPSDRMYDFSKDLFPALLAMRAPLYGCVAEGYWCDIGDLNAYLQANMDLLHGRLRFTPPPAPEAEGAILEDVVLGPGCTVAPGATVRQSVLWKGVHVAEGATVLGTVACDQVEIEADAATYPGAVIGKGSRVSTGAIVCPGVRLWPGRIVEEGARADSHLIQSPAQSNRMLRSGGLMGLLGQDLLPETVVRAGTAFANLIKGDAPILIGCDEERPGGLLKQALACGVMAAGRDVVDLGLTASPVTQFMLTQRRAAGGIHVRCAGDGRAYAAFFGPDGRPLPRDLERKLEQALTRQDILRAGPESAGSLETASGSEFLYLHHVLESADVAAIKKAGFSLQIDGPAWPVLIPWAAGLGCKLTPVGPADLHVAIDPLTAHLTVAGLTADQMLTLEVLLALRMATPMDQEVCLPVTAPSSVEALLRKSGRKARRVRRDEYHRCDPIVVLTTLLEWMARENLREQEITARLPDVKIASLCVPCPWEAKGRVMRRLLEEHQDQAVELVDGLRLQRPDGWVLFLPDPEEAVYRVYVEGDAPEQMASVYCERLQQLIDGVG